MLADVACINPCQHFNVAGVNPMITTEAIAYMVGEGLAAKYKHLGAKRRAPVDIKYEES